MSDAAGATHSQGLSLEKLVSHSCRCQGLSSITTSHRFQSSLTCLKASQYEIIITREKWNQSIKSIFYQWEQTATTIGAFRKTPLWFRTVKCICKWLSQREQKAALLKNVFSSQVTEKWDVSTSPLDTPEETAWRLGCSASSNRSPEFIPVQVSLSKRRLHHNSLSRHRVSVHQALSAEQLTNPTASKEGPSAGNRFCWRTRTAQGSWQNLITKFK